MDTLVNSANGSVTDLDEENTSKRLDAHCIYKHYQDLHAKHALGNPLCASLKQSIRPKLTGNTLVGPDKITFRSPGLLLVDDAYLSQFSDFEDTENSNNSSYTFFHLGSMLSGHPQIVHGGLVATLMDELTCFLGFQSLPSKKGVTANLNINYFKPCLVNSYIMVKCTVSRKNGRKCWVKGQIFHLDLDTDIEEPISDFVEKKDNLLSECECLIIEPRWVQELQA